MREWHITPIQWRNLSEYDQIIMLAHIKEVNLRKNQAHKASEEVNKRYANKKDN